MAPAAMPQADDSSASVPLPVPFTFPSLDELPPWPTVCASSTRAERDKHEHTKRDVARDLREPRVTWDPGGQAAGVERGKGGDKRRVYPSLKPLLDHLTGHTQRRCDGVGNSRREGNEQQRRSDADPGEE
eukprot:scaffold46589_cov33-Tisochrysis_lutea.AAC.1